MGGNRVVRTRTTPLLVLAALIVAGTLTAAHAQEVNWRPLAVDMEVVEVVREPVESGDGYTVTINATSTGAETLYVDLAQAISDGQSYPNECGSEAWLYLEPDETLTLVGCYTVPEQGELELVFLAGLNQSEGRPDAFKLLPFL